VGIRVGDVVFDNLHPQGMHFAEWLTDFDAVGGVVVDRVRVFEEMGMSDVLTLLKEMRGRLGMYLGSTSLSRLAAFLRGYEHAEKLAGKEDAFLGEFRDWILQRFHTTQHAWEDAILHHSADEQDAVNRFWSLLDEYVNARVERPRQADGKRNGPADREATDGRQDWSSNGEKFR
jgi:hypothetical protein